MRETDDVHYEAVGVSSDGLERYGRDDRAAVPRFDGARPDRRGQDGRCAGAPADLCIFDPDAHWRVERAALRSQGKNTPFLGLEMPARVRYTVVGGQVVYEA